MICGLLAGLIIGFLIYKGGNKFALQIFLIVSTCFLYLVSAGLFSKSVWSFEMHAVSQSVPFLARALLTSWLSGVRSLAAMQLKLALDLAVTISVRVFGT